jgi:fucose permease
MESYYHISYSIMSLVFVGNAIGFIIAAFFTDMLLGKLGRGKTLILGDMIQLAAYIVLVCTPPYPLVVISFFLLGYGAAVNLALNNVYCANTHPPSVILGWAHGSYGIGGVVAPIIGTALVSNGVLWSRFYFLAVGLRICCVAFAAYAFWSYKEDSEHTLLTALESTASRQPAKSKMHDLKVALGSKVTIFGALFIFAYQGAEVSISGWIISYLIKYRDGDPAKVGYVTAGFWVCIPPSNMEIGFLLMCYRAVSHSDASSSRTSRPGSARRNSSSFSPSAHSRCNFSRGSYPTSLATQSRCLC